MTTQFAHGWLPTGIQNLDGEDLVGIVVDEPFNPAAATAADVAADEVADRFTATGQVQLEEDGWTLFALSPTSTDLDAPCLGIWLATDGATDADRKLVTYSELTQASGTVDPSWDSGVVFLPFESRGPALTAITSTDGTVTPTPNEVDPTIIDLSMPGLTKGYTGYDRTSAVSGDIVQIDFSDLATTSAVITVVGGVTVDVMGLPDPDRTDIELVVFRVSGTDPIGLRLGNVSVAGDALAYDLEEDSPQVGFTLTPAPVLVTDAQPWAVASYFPVASGSASLPIDASDVVFEGDPLDEILTGVGGTLNGLDGRFANLAWKIPVRAVSTTSIDFGGSPNGAHTFDGVVLADGDLVLVAAQSTGANNGLYVVATGGAWGRTGGETPAGSVVSVGPEGSSYGSTLWRLNTPDPIVVGTTATTWEQIVGSGGAPSGAAGGDLSGTYPDPTIAAGAVTLAKQADLAQATIIGRSAGAGTGAPTALSAPQVRTAAGLVIGTDVEAHDTDLTTIAGLSPSNDDLLQRKSGAWINRTPAQVKTDLGLSNVDNTSDATKALLVANNQTGTTYTLVLGDAGKVIEANNASAITITVPTNSSVAFPIGTVIEVFQMGAGQVTVSGAGVTFRTPHGAKTAVQYGVMALWKRDTDTWVISGDSTT